MTGGTWKLIRVKSLSKAQHGHPTTVYSAAMSSLSAGKGRTATGPNGDASRPVLLFVMGMHRSGTAALTRAISLCGGALPPGLAGANSGNPLGYWEPRKAIYINEAILHRHRSNWADPTLRLEDDGEFDAEENDACVAEIGAFLDTLPAARLVVIKDPRITILSGMWLDAARAVGFDTRAVIAVRHPQEVIASLGRRDGASPELSSALWLKYSLLAERNTRGMPRVVVEYANLLDDWRRQMTRISEVLAVDLNTRDEPAIDEFLKQDLRRQRHGGDITEFLGSEWLSTTYRALSSASRDELLDESALDRVFDAFRASEKGFRAAFEDYHDHFNFNSVLSRPSIQKLVGEAMAMAHRRDKTWA
jgi:hypothetical protein